MFKHVQPDSSGRETNAACQMNFNNCPMSATASIVNEFANNNTVFMQAFGQAFQKLVETGYQSHELVTAGVEFPTTTDPTSDVTVVTDSGNIMKSLLYIAISGIIVTVASI